MLEFYRKEKKDNVAKLSELYSVTKQAYPMVKGCLPFDAFYELIAGEYDKSITDLDVAHLYRQAYVFGGSAINVDSVLVAVCNR